MKLLTEKVASEVYQLLENCQIKTVEDMQNVLKDISDAMLGTMLKDEIDKLRGSETLRCPVTEITSSSPNIRDMSTIQSKVISIYALHHFINTSVQL